MASANDLYARIGREGANKAVYLDGELVCYKYAEDEPLAIRQYEWVNNAFKKIIITMDFTGEFDSMFHLKGVSRRIICILYRIVGICDILVFRHHEFRSAR